MQAADQRLKLTHTKLTHNTFKMSLHLKLLQINKSFISIILIVSVGTSNTDNSLKTNKL